MALFTKSPIRAKVMAAVNAKIDQAEIAYAKAVEELENSVEEQIQQIRNDHESKKGWMLDDHVQAILGKIL